MVERFNQTIQGMLVKFIGEKKETWEDYLDTCIYAYNTSRHESSRFTPFELMFGRKAVLPIDLNSGGNGVGAEKVIKDGADDEVHRNMQDARRRKLEDAKANILSAQQKQKENYDLKHHQPEVFAIGAIVLKKDFTRKKRKGGKLDTKWTGPYTITKVLGRGLYSLEEVKDPSRVISRVNGVHLKPYHQPPEVLSLLKCAYNNIISFMVFIPHYFTGQGCIRKGVTGYNSIISAILPS